MMPNKKTSKKLTWLEMSKTPPCLGTFSRPVAQAAEGDPEGGNHVLDGAIPNERRQGAFAPVDRVLGDGLRNGSKRRS